MSLKKLQKKMLSEDRLLRVVAILGGRAKIEVLMYEGNLVVEQLLDWIRSIDIHFDYEEVYEEKRVKHGVIELKGHETLGWVTRVLSMVKRAQSLKF
jgi:hypothetical protein